MGYNKNTCEICNKPINIIVGAGEDFEYSSLKGPFLFALCKPCNHLTLTFRPDRYQLKEIYPSTYQTVNPKSPLFLKGYIYKKKIIRILPESLSSFKEGTSGISLK